MSGLPSRPSSFVNQRRSQRVLLAVPLEVSGKQSNNVSFTERTTTIIVNSHGALLHLQAPVVCGQSLTLKHARTEEESRCTVVDIFSGQNGISEVAVEFPEPCPRFWRVTFPPVDWSPRSAEAKKFILGSPAIKPPLAKK